jgi:hypothetical protein
VLSTTTVILEKVFEGGPIDILLILHHEDEKVFRGDGLSLEDSRDFQRDYTFNDDKELGANIAYKK